MRGIGVMIRQRNILTVMMLLLCFSACGLTDDLAGLLFQEPPPESPEPFWAMATNTAGFTQRTGHAAFVYNDQMWVVGGSVYSVALSDIWASTNGTNWNFVANSTFYGRSSMRVVVLSNRFVMIGGSSNIVKFGDILTTSDGLTWTSNLAPFSARSSFGAHYFQGKIWVFCGATADTYQTNDVWCSEDGSNWTIARTNIGFGGRFAFASVVFRNAIWLMGGYSSPTNGSGGTQATNEVWFTTNGTEWQRANQAAPFGNRTGCRAEVFRDQIWLVGGYIGTNYTNDVWTSKDGTNWTLVTASAPFQGRYGHSLTVYQSSLWLIAGMKESVYTSEVWYCR